MSLEGQLSAVDSFDSAVSKAGLESTKFKQGIDMIKTTLKDASKDARAGTAVVTTFKAAVAAVPDLTSGDSTTALTALFGIVGTIAEMTGPQGVVISIVLSLVSGIISASDQGSRHSVTDVIRDVMQHFNDQAMRNKAAGTLDKFRVALDTLYGYSYFTLSSTNVTRLNNEIQNTIGASFLGELASDMESQAGQAKTVEEAEKVLQFVRTYCILSLRRELILGQKWLLLKLSKQDDVSTHTLENCVIPREIASIREKLKFIHLPRSGKGAAVASLYNPSDWPIISDYMKRVGVPDPLHPKPEQHTMRVSYWEPMWVSTAYDVDVTRISSASNFWLMHSRVKNPPRHTYQYFGLFGIVESPLSPEEFIQKDKVNDFNSIKMTSIDDNTYLLSAKAAPCDFFQRQLYFPFSVRHKKAFFEAYSRIFPLSYVPFICDYYTIKAHTGVSEEALSHWVFLTPE